MDSLVSVIIPVYNVEDYLDKCVESVITQTHRNIEVILVDDGSSDACPQKCDEWAGKDSRIMVIHKKNGGVSSARNTGLDYAKGAYITFVDSDDYIVSDAVESMLQRITQDQSDMVIARKVLVYPNGELVLQDPSKVMDMVISKEVAFRMIGTQGKLFPASLYAKLYRSFVFKGLRFLDLKMGEDKCAVPYIVDQCSLISIMDKVVYYYYQRSTSTVHTMTRNKQLDEIKAASIVGRFLLDRGYLQETKTFYLAAVCGCLDLRCDSEAKEIITKTFSPLERKKLRPCDKKSILCVLAHSFPHIYKLYQSLKGT